MPVSPRWRLAAVLSTAFAVGLPAAAQTALPAAGQAPPAAPLAAPSALDAPLFYQLLIGEMELRSGQPGNAFAVILDAARRTKDAALFRRATDIALQARAGDQALTATQAWRLALPDSLDALRLQLQILSALNRALEAAEPLTALLSRTPAAQRGGLIASLPGYLQRAPDRTQTAALLDKVLAPYADNPATAMQARVALGRVWLAAGNGDKALAFARKAQAGDPSAPGPALLGMELMATVPAAEALVTHHLQQPGAEVQIRLAYVRTLTTAQRYADAVTQLKIVTRERPLMAPPYLSLGALHLELREPAEGEAALLRYVDLVQAPAEKPAAAIKPAPAEGQAADTDADDEEDPSGASAGQGLVQAWLMLAQAAEQRGDFPAAETWLARIDDPKRALDVQARRASLLARQGKLDQARELIRKAPEREPGDARAKLVAEAGVLRDVKQWKAAEQVLAEANERFAGDVDLLYEQAMVVEKLDRLDDMERLLRRVIGLKPDHAHAHNALGYSLADRGLRLPEARQLIQRALEILPDDPFITDSLGWVEFRAGNVPEALRLLRKAYAARPDTEIAAHLGEVLWAAGERDEARRVWREARVRDAANDVLQETLARLKADL